MSSPFGARRKARAIRQHEDSDEDKMEIDSLGTGVRSHGKSLRLYDCLVFLTPFTIIDG